jgi:hypothetical protein
MDRGGRVRRLLLIATAVAGVMVGARDVRAALDFPFARYQMVDESGTIMWGQCPANVAVRRTFVVQGTPPVACPDGYDELYRGLLVGATGGDVGRCWAGDGAPPGLTASASCVVCWGPVRERPCIQAPAEGRQAVAECGAVPFAQPHRIGLGKPQGSETPGTVRLTGSAIVVFGATECPMPDPIDPAQATMPAAYRTQPGTLLYRGKVYAGANGALGGQCWEEPPHGPAGTWTPIGDCAVCQ